MNRSGPVGVRRKNVCRFFFVLQYPQCVVGMTLNVHDAALSTRYAD